MKKILLMFLLSLSLLSQTMDLSKMKIILIHGNGGSTADNHWFPVVAEQLRNSGLNVINCQFPETYFAYAHVWLPFLKETLQVDENTILIGHSSGAVAALKFAEKNKIFGSILVGSYYTDLGFPTEKKSGYFDTSWDWNAIKNNQQWIIQFSSTDDPWIPINEPRFVHKMVHSEYHEFNDQGHFDKEHHKIAFPELVEAIKEKLAMR